MYALFKDGIQISKAHSTYIAAQIEAFERKIYYRWRWGLFIDDRYKILEKKDE